jgi:hypothetical protein
MQYGTTDKLIKNEVLEMAERLEQMDNVIKEIEKRS